MSDRPETIRVNIYGREYSIRGEADPGYIAEIAHYLDMKMRQMTDNATVASTTKVAILAALNITDELFQRDGRIRELEESQVSDIARLLERVEKALAETSAPPPVQSRQNTAHERVESPAQAGITGSTCVG
ncbi:cell division protein ZapA [Candidatus Fermentibacteria bacterium]|nr:cell division protein ZapA [Candidatus Fermentibacteria bacterium]